LNTNIKLGNADVEGDSGIGFTETITNETDTGLSSISESKEENLNVNEKEEIF